MTRLQAALVAALLLAGFAVQLHFFRTYPRPVLFGDPAGYYKVGERFQEAAARLRAGEDARAVFESVRGAFPLLGVGLLFAAMDAARPQDWGFFQRVLGLFNTAAMLGAFLLARRLSGRFAGGIAALLLGLVYPTFSVQTGRLYPDPVTGCLLVWAAWLYAEAVHRTSARLVCAAGLLFGAALVLRAQLMTYMALVIGATLLATAAWWARSASSRRLVAAFVLGCLPAAAAWVVIARATGDRDDVVQLGNATFKPLYPYGFWQFLETDGWIGPYRFKTEPYYQALQEAGRADPRLMRSRARQWAFTARYVAARPLPSLLLVLDNAYRLYDRPANDYKWDYPLPYAWQVALQRLVLVLAVAGAALFTAERKALAGVFLVPAALAVLHGLVFPWPRYNVPVMPILLASAGAAAVSLVAGGAAAWRRSPAVSTLGVGALLLVLAALAFAPAPGLARVLRVLGWMAVVAAPFLMVARLRPGRGGRVAAAVGVLVVALPLAAHALRDRRWHETLTAVGAPGTAAVEQEIELGPEATGALRAAPEAFLVLDLRVPRGDLSRTLLRVGGREMPGSALVPTMPRLRESTSTGGRDWRGYPQWWAVPFDPAWLPPAGQPLRVRLTHQGETPLLLGGDRFGRQDRVYEGPSFGDWPNVVALKLEYDGDYRIPVTLPLGSARSRSFVVDAGGARRALPGVLRVRVVTLRNNEGSLHWRSAPLPATRQVALAFSAWSGHRGQARLDAGLAASLRLPLGARTAFELRTGGGVTLCHRYEGERGEKAYGSYVLHGPVDGIGTTGAPVTARLRFATGMNDQPMFFVVDRDRPLDQTLRALGTCVPPAAVAIDGVTEIIDATRNNYPEDTGRWAVAEVF